MDDLYELCEKIFQDNEELYCYNRNKIIEQYKREFVLLEGYLEFSMELGEKVDDTNKSPDKSYFEFAMLRLHERGVKIFCETMILMKNGSSSGAMARWRVLQEITVVSLLLIKYPKLAEKYIEYIKIQEYQVIRRKKEFKSELKITYFDQDKYQEMEEECEMIKRKNGWKCRSNFEWALCEEIKVANLLELSKEVGLEYMYAYIDEANMYNHGSTFSLVNDRGSREDNNMDVKFMLSPFEMFLPLQLIACSMHQLNSALVKSCLIRRIGKKHIWLAFLKQNKELIDTILNTIDERLSER